MPSNKINASAMQQNANALSEAARKEKTALPALNYTRKIHLFESHCGCF
ncbi:MAG: hypothetical protein R2793_08660 [Flavobacteriaceae bacterium]